MDDVCKVKGVYMDLKQEEELVSAISKCLKYENKIKELKKARDNDRSLFKTIEEKAAIVRKFDLEISETRAEYELIGVLSNVMTDAKLAESDRMYAAKVLLVISKDKVSDKILNFKEWLKSEGVDVKLFWKNCKRKYNGFGNQRKILSTVRPSMWVLNAFDWELALQTNIPLTIIDDRWSDKVKEVLETEDMKIEFGFGSKKC